MQLEVSKDLKLQVVTSDNKVTDVLGSFDYRKMKGNISAQALGYAREHDLVDCIKVGREYLIVMTEKSCNYSPRDFSSAVCRQS